MSADEYTPTTEEVRDYIRTADRVTAHMFAAGADSVEAFDRWLAAHDAEVRAGVVAEEPEWEVGYQLTQDDGASIGTGWPYPTVEEAARDGHRRATETNEDYPMYPRVHSVVVRRRKAGPWVPVKQEGANDAMAS